MVRQMVVAQGDEQLGLRPGDRQTHLKAAGEKLCSSTQAPRVMTTHRLSRKQLQKTDLRPSRMRSRASLVVQWLRICLPMQGTRVRALVWEDPTCRGATRPVSHNY